MQVEINELLEEAIKNNASDIHLQVGLPVFYRVAGAMKRSNNNEIISDLQIMHILSEIIPSESKDVCRIVNELDFSYDFEGKARFRVNVSKQLGNFALVFRVVPSKIPTIEELKLPRMINRLSSIKTGLILVTGPTGSGKSTTLAAILGKINKEEAKHIITIEDPIEYIHKSDKCLVTQRQVGFDTESYNNGLKYALRQDPDIILIGEIRDKETMDIAFMAAQTGHLVFASLHTTDANHTINRILSFYSPSEYDKIREQLAETLRVTVAQQLVKIKNSQNNERLPVCEILFVTPTVADFIVKNETQEIYNLVNQGSFGEMLSFNTSLVYLIKNNIVSAEEALNVSNDKVQLKQMLRGDLKF